MFGLTTLQVYVYFSWSHQATHDGLRFKYLVRLAIALNLVGSYRLLRITRHTCVQIIFVWCVEPSFETFFSVNRMFNRLLSGVHFVISFTSVYLSAVSMFKHADRIYTAIRCVSGFMRYHAICEECSQLLDLRHQVNRGTSQQWTT